MKNLQWKSDGRNRNKMGSKSRTWLFWGQILLTLWTFSLLGRADASGGGVTIGTMLTSLSLQVLNLDSLLLGKKDPIARLNVKQILHKYGYNSIEEHSVTAKDGYITSLFRIPRGKGPFAAGGGQPVLILHGAYMSSVDWFHLSEERVLPLLLAEAGFDVWLGNTRGSKYSQGHVRNLNSATGYYEWSNDDIVAYELPSWVDLIVNKTQSKINVVGYSISSAQFLSFLAYSPEYQAKINKVTLLAPGHFYNSRSPLLKLLFLFRINLAKTTIARLLEHGPGAISPRVISQLTHWMHNPNPTYFDFGPTENLKKYGQAIVPTYDLSRIKIPIQCFYGLNDRTIIAEEARRTISQLNVVNTDTAAVPDANFGHLDFLTHDQAHTLVYSQILRYFDNRQSPSEGSSLENLSYNVALKLFNKITGDDDFAKALSY